MSHTGTTEKQVRELQRSLEKTQWTIQDLATMGTMITSIRDIDTILSVVMEMSIRMVDGEVGLIQLAENGVLTPKVNWGVDDTVVKNIIYKDDLDISEYCFRNREAVVVENYDMKIEHGPSINSFLALPIHSNTRCHGTIIIINKASGGLFKEADLKNIEMLINFAAISIDNCLLLEESLQKQKLEQELAIARQIQETILPDSEVKIPGIDIGTVYFPAREIGGDFYDVVKLNDSEFWAVIGDVTNKGIPAALVMTATSAIIKSELKNNPGICPGDLIANLNNILCDGIIKSRDMFVTLFVARINLENKTIVYCNAGHLPPLYWDVADETVVELKEGGTFVGQFAGLDFDEGERQIASGDSLFTFTDGLTEASDAHNELFGTERAIQVLISGYDIPAEQFCMKVKEWVNRFAEGGREDMVDDFTLMKINFNMEKDE